MHMARLNFILLALLFALISSMSCFEAPRKIAKTEKQQGEELLLEDIWRSTTPLSVLPRDGSPTPPKGHAVTTNAKLFVDTDRVLQSVPSPGHGH